MNLQAAGAIVMHEISDQIQDVGRKLATITALLEERTERRNHDRT